MRNFSFKSHLRGKTVALVGPANYLSEFEFGKEINSRDIVIRINRGMELVENHSKQVGDRTDVLYSCLIEHPDNAGRIDIKNLLDNNVKWVCTIPHSSARGEKTYPFLSPQVNLIKVLKVFLKINLHIFNIKKYGELNKNLKARANTGFAAIFDLLQYDIKELYITGFSFYMDPFMKGYKKGCSRNEEEFAKDCFTSIRHDQFNQWEFLKKHKDHPLLRFDPVLDEILKLETLDKNLFNAIIENVKNS